MGADASNDGLLALDQMATSFANALYKSLLKIMWSIWQI
jgi:hypothetical protein